LTVAVTVGFAVYEGWDRHLPQLFADASILTWLFRRSLLARWSEARARMAARRRETQRARRRAASRASLRLVEAHDDDDLPPEIEDQLRDIFNRGPASRPPLRPPETGVSFRFKGKRPR
jgi:hypothetical protein